MPKYLIPPLLTFLVSLGVTALIFFKIPPETQAVKIVFTISLSLFMLSGLSLAIHFLGSRKRLRRSFLASLRLVILPVGYLLLKFFQKFNATTFLILLIFWVAVNLAPFAMKRRLRKNLSGAVGEL